MELAWLKGSLKNTPEDSPFLELISNSSIFCTLNRGLDELEDTFMDAKAAAKQVKSEGDRQINV